MPTTTSATGSSEEPSAEHGERERRHRDEREVVGAADEREAEAPAVRRHEPGDERQRRRQRQRDADPLADPGDDERQPVAGRIDARQEQHAGADEVGNGADGEQPEPAEAVDKCPADEGRRDLDDRRKPDDDADLRVGYARPGERNRQRGGEAMEPGLKSEQREGEADEHRPIFAQPAAR